MGSAHFELEEIKRFTSIPCKQLPPVISLMAFTIWCAIKQYAIGSAILIDIPTCKMHLGMILLLQKVIGTHMEKVKAEIVLVTRFQHTDWTKKSKAMIMAIRIGSKTTKNNVPVFCGFICMFFLFLF